MQMMNVFLCRHPLKSSLSFGLFSNPYILMGLAAELALILFIIYTPAGNWLFGTAPIGVEVWLLALAGAALMWVLEEARKAWQRRVVGRGHQRLTATRSRCDSNRRIDAPRTRPLTGDWASSSLPGATLPRAAPSAGN